MTKLRKLLPVILLLVVCIAGFAAWRWFRRPVPAASLTIDERRELIHQKNQGLGLLENGKFSDAEETFRHISDLVPDDPLGPRNLATALLAPNDEGQATSTGQDNKAKTNELFTVVDHLLAVDGKTASSQLFAGRVDLEYLQSTLFEGESDRDRLRKQAEERFERAGALDPQDPAPLFGIYLVEERSGEPGQISRRGLEALQSASRRDPENVAALMELLSRLAQEHARETAPVLEKTLHVLPNGPGLSERERQTRSLLTEAHALLEKQKPDWPSVLQRVRQAHNLAKTMPAFRDDYRRLFPFLLAFALTDFRPAFYAGLPDDQVENAPHIRLAEFRPPDVPAGDVLDLAWEDVDGSGKGALILLRPKAAGASLEVHGGGRPFAPLVADGSYSHFRLANLEINFEAGAPPGRDLAELDLVLYGADGVRLYENRSAPGRHEWVDRTPKDFPGKGRQITWLTVFDMDNDGNLDLVFGTPEGIHILRNRGAWQFEDITARSPGIEALATTAAVYGDFDADADLDLIVLTKTGDLVFIENRRSGRFVPHAPQKVAAGVGSPLCLLAFDADNDGRLDLAVGGTAGAALYLAEAGRSFPEAARIVELPGRSPVTGMGYFDVDNDGWLDLWLRTGVAGEPLKLLRNIGSSRFEPVDVPALHGPFATATVGDVKDDGQQDILLAGPAGLIGLRNETGNQNHWLNLRLRALALRGSAEEGQGAKSNYFGLGSTVEVLAGRHRQTQLVTGRTVHFGLGAHPQADLVLVTWTNGVPQAFLRVEADRTLVEEQAPKGSCPYLYAWNGERFEFITDCLWASALGMRLPDGNVMGHARDENYLCIPGDKLRAREGCYTLQFTNEMWETPYLDSVELLVAEHPAGARIVTNERVGSPGEGRVFWSVRQPRSPVTARDHRGRDVLSKIQRRDGVLLGGFKRQRYVGLAEPHWVELDLGDLRNARRVTLFLTGWVWPTDTSANMAISRDPRFGGKTGVVGGAGPPVILVPDGKHGWKTAVQNVGLPNGKMQTLAVDLTGAWAVPAKAGQKSGGLKARPTDFRVRVATTMELYWDEIFFTVDESPVPFPTHKLPVTRADLHYRGYSRRYQESPISPFWFDYDDLDLRPRWLHVPGPYTRYGAVTELLGKPDSRYVVMSPGDELTLEFDALPPLPPGRERTFIFHASGWLKDFDMNGTAGEGVLPLPFEGMKDYPYQPPEQYPDSPDFRRFLEEFTTRD